MRVMCCLDIAIAYSATTVLPADVCASSKGGGEDSSVREIEIMCVCVLCGLVKCCAVQYSVMHCGGVYCDAV